MVLICWILVSEFFTFVHLLILFSIKLFSSSEYFSFVWLITFRIETFSFSDHWRFKMLINSQSQGQNTKLFLVKTEQESIWSVLPNFPAWQHYDRKFHMLCHEHCGHCVKPGKYLNMWRQLFSLLWIVKLQSSVKSV